MSAEVQAKAFYISRFKKHLLTLERQERGGRDKTKQINTTHPFAIPAIHSFSG